QNNISVRPLLMAVLASLLLLGCQDRDPAFIEPMVAFSLEKDAYEVFEILRIQNEGQGQFYSVFTGDAGHRYALRDSGDTGFKTDVNGNFTYSYTSAGTYTITYVASGYRLNSGERVEQIMEKQVVVTDPDISTVRIQAMEVGNSSVNNNKFLDPISFLFKDFRNTADTIDNQNQKIALSFYRPDRLGEIKDGRYNQFSVPADLNIIPKIKLNTASNTVRIQIDGIDEFKDGQTRVIHETEDDLRFQEKEYRLVNNEGQTKTYVVCPMIIPEFVNFSLAGVNGRLELTAGDYNEFMMNVDLPDGTDLSSLVADWTAYDEGHTKVWVNGVEQQSGISSLDYSEPVEFTLEYTQPKGPEDSYEGSFQATSRILVTVE
ncbi:MAG: hypothetical protein AAF804_14505, partial [Bacteroidota bacterium]